MKNVLTMIFKYILFAFLFISNMAIYALGFPAYFTYVKPFVIDYMNNLLEYSSKIMYIFCKIGYSLSALCLVIMCVIYTLYSIIIFCDHYEKD